VKSLVDLYKPDGQMTQTSGDAPDVPGAHPTGIVCGMVIIVFTGAGIVITMVYARFASPPCGRSHTSDESVDESEGAHAVSMPSVRVTDAPTAPPVAFTGCTAHTSEVRMSGTPNPTPSTRALTGERIATSAGANIPDTGGRTTPEGGWREAL
jgi:hypothetical protein